DLQLRWEQLDGTADGDVRLDLGRRYARGVRQDGIAHLWYGWELQRDPHGHGRWRDRLEDTTGHGLGAATTAAAATAATTAPAATAATAATTATTAAAAAAAAAARDASGVHEGPAAHSVPQRLVLRRSDGVRLAGGNSYGIHRPRDSQARRTHRPRCVERHEERQRGERHRHVQ